MPQQVTEYLQSQRSLTNNQRADLWDAFYQTRGTDDLVTALRKINVPDDVKADLWDMKAGRYSSPEPEAPKDDLANLDPEVQERIRKHRAILSGGQQVGNAVQFPQRIPQTPQGALKQISGRTISPEEERSIQDEAGTGAAVMAAQLALIPPALRGVQALRGLPGAAGAGVRVLSNPKTVAGATAAYDLYSGKGPLDTAQDVATNYLLATGAGTAAKGAEALPGRLGRVARLFNMAGRGGARGRPPAPTRLPPGASTTGTTPTNVPPPNVRVQVPPTEVAAPLSTSGTVPAQAPNVPYPRWGTPPGPPPSISTSGVNPARVGYPRTLQAQPVGASAASGGTTAPKVTLPRSAGAGYTPRAAAEAPAYQTPIGQARSVNPSNVPRAPQAGDLAAELRLSGRLANAPQAVKDVAKEIMQQRYGGLSLRTPSGAPGQVAHSLYENLGPSKGITSPSMAQRFINEILRVEEGG